MKSTLVIHPRDKSTDFLKPIYENIEYKTIITGGMTQSQVHEQISKHDRIIMMGHGSPNGLFNVSNFIRCGHVINLDSVPFLIEKEAVYIWCHADKFVDKHKLKGFYSGMFISEVGEAYMHQKEKSWTKNCIIESNNKFADILGKTINKTLDITHEIVTKEYGIFAENNAIASYNNDRLYYR